MNAKELMIGDWVMMRLSQFTQWLTDKVGIVLPGNGIEYEPISLSEDILMANGFEVAYKSPNLTMLVLYDDNEGFCLNCVFFAQNSEEVKIVIKASKPSRSSIETTIRFVHEFQHTIRLCGLNELADNFKIE